MNIEISDKIYEQLGAQAEGQDVKIDDLIEQSLKTFASIEPALLTRLLTYSHGTGFELCEIIDSILVSDWARHKARKTTGKYHPPRALFEFQKAKAPGGSERHVRGLELLQRLVPVYQYEMENRLLGEVHLAFAELEEKGVAKEYFAGIEAMIEEEIMARMKKIEERELKAKE